MSEIRYLRVRVAVEDRVDGTAIVERTAELEGGDWQLRSAIRAAAELAADDYAALQRERAAGEEQP